MALVVFGVSRRVARVVLPVLAVVYAVLWLLWRLAGEVVALILGRWADPDV